jgi:membrane dipeptidase
MVTGGVLQEDDYAGRAKQVLRSTPLIDGHNDFPFLIRQQLRNKIYDTDFKKERLTSHSDFEKMREGKMGGQFWSVYVSCPEDLVPGVDLTDVNKRVPEIDEPSVRGPFSLILSDLLDWTLLT